MLAIMINKAKENGQVPGLIPHLVDGGVSILQYVHDIIIFLEHDLEKALNMKLVLCIFKQLSGLKITRFFCCFGKAKEVMDQYRQLFGCESGSSTFQVFGDTDSFL
jgi:hypothetical protein